MFPIPWSYIEKTSTILGLLGSFFALFAWIQAIRISRNVKKEKERLGQAVQIVLQGENENNVIQLPVPLKRRDVVRNEVLGLIGMLPMEVKGSRYEIKFLSSPSFLNTLSKIQDAEQESVLTIHCTNDEINQFDRKKLADDNN